MLGKLAVLLGAGVVATALAAAPPAAAQVVGGDVETGQKLAQEWCSGCHMVDAKTTEARDAVPSFAAIAKMPSTTSMSLRAWLQTPHPRMPDWQLTGQQINEVVAYILSLRGG